MIFWKEIVIYQVCSGSVSFLASSTIVTFIAKSGLVTPYRRLIFGLSVSDMCQSFAILAGPWLVRSDIPQALWGIGNKGTCQLDGFLYAVGVTAVPMYTVCLCIYYVCKLKGRMTDSQITNRIEKKMHIAIIVINLGLYLTALGMDTINPSFFGSFCTPANYPTGCNQNPAAFGECDPSIGPAANFFIIIGIAITPSLALVAIIGCITMIFWHVVMRERIFGRGSAATRTGGDSHPATAPTITHRRNRHLRPSSSSDPNESYQGGSKNSTPSDDAASCGFEDDESETREENPPQNNDLDENYVFDDIEGFSSLLEVSTDATNDATRNESSTDIPEASDNALLTLDAAVTNDSKVSKDWSVCGGAMLNISRPFTSTEEPLENGTRDHATRSDRNRPYPSQHLRQSTRFGGNGATDPNANMETLSYIYKKELLSQICCYVIAFCLTTMPYLILNVRSVQGIVPSNNFFRVNAILYPLVGFFNIIVYTRWNVRSWRRKHPECSRLLAFWLVLKAGGDLPSEEEWNKRTTSTPSLQFLADSDTSISAIQFGAIAPQNNTHSTDLRIGGEVESSVKARDGSSFSLTTGDLNYNPESQWSHVKGGSGGSELPRSDAASNTTLDHHNHGDGKSQHLVSNAHSSMTNPELESGRVNLET